MADQTLAATSPHALANSNEDGSKDHAMFGPTHDVTDQNQQNPTSPKERNAEITMVLVFYTAR